MRASILLGLLVLAACRTGGAPAQDPRIAPLAPEQEELALAQLPPNLSIEGRLIEYRVYGHGRDTVLFLATIHGDEAAGTALIEAFLARLDARPQWLAGRRAVIVPVLNPDGREARRRTNANGVDLNRNFPAANWDSSRRHGYSPLSEPETRFLAGLIDAYRPATIVSFHQPSDLIDYDGPGGALAHHLAACSPLEVKRMGPRPGSLGSYAGTDLGIPVLTVELPRTADRLSSEESWERYGALLIEALRFDTQTLLPAEDLQRDEEGEHAPPELNQ